MAKEIKKYAKVIYILSLIISLALNPIKGTHLLEILLASGLSVTAGETIITYAKDHLRKQKSYQKKKQNRKDFTDTEKEMKTEKSLAQPILSKNTVEADEYISLKEEQIEELKKNLPLETRLDINSVTRMIKMVEKMIVTNRDPKELSKLKKQLIQFEFQLYDLFIGNCSKDILNTMNIDGKRYTKNLSYE